MVASATQKEINLCSLSVHSSYVSVFHDPIVLYSFSLFKDKKSSLSGEVLLFHEEDFTKPKVSCPYFPLLGQ